VERGGKKIQRYLGYYYDLDLVKDIEERIQSKINDYFFGGGSQKYRAREVGKSRQILARQFRRLRDERLDDLEIIKEFKPDWGEDSRDGGVIVCLFVDLSIRIDRAF
jgi:DNA invertase Pin-like site-specific DNA recombinase